MLDIRENDVRPVSAPEERLFQDLMQQHHYLGVSAQDRRKPLVRGCLARAMGCTFFLFRRFSVFAV